MTWSSPADTQVPGILCYLPIPGGGTKNLGLAPLWKKKNVRLCLVEKDVDLAVLGVQELREDECW